MFLFVVIFDEWVCWLLLFVGIIIWFLFGIGIV